MRQLPELTHMTWIKCLRKFKGSGTLTIDRLRAYWSVIDRRKHAILSNSVSLNLLFHCAVYAVPLIIILYNVGRISPRGSPRRRQWSLKTGLKTHLSENPWALRLTCYSRKPCPTLYDTHAWPKSVRSKLLSFIRRYKRSEKSHPHLAPLRSANVWRKKIKWSSSIDQHSISPVEEASALWRSGAVTGTAGTVVPYLALLKSCTVKKI